MTAIQSHSPAATPDFSAIKTRQRAMWAAGDYGRIGETLHIVAETLCESVDLRSGERVLDVATGTGNVALVATQRYAHAVGVDYVPALLERARQRAAVERLEIEFVEGDAESLPFDDGSFDVVMSTFGVMFAPNQDRAAAELLRVCRPGGRIGLASWTPDGLIGQMFRILGRYVAPPPGLKPPSAWGNEQRIDEMFGASAATLVATRRIFNFRYLSTEHWLEMFRTYYGPIQVAFEKLSAGDRDALAADLVTLAREFNRPGRTGLVLPSEYLEVVIEKRQ